MNGDFRYFESTTPLELTSINHDYILDYNVNNLQFSIQNPYYDPSLPDSKGRNALHVLLRDEFKGTLKQNEMLDCLKTIFRSKKEAIGCFKDMCNARCVSEDNLGETPLSLAVYNGFEHCVQFLVDNGADTTKQTTNFPKEQDLAYEIAKCMPNVMISILDNAIKHDEECGKNYNLVKLEWKPILQENSTGKKSAVRETRFLYRLLDIPMDNKVEILSHPLIRAFLHLKHFIPDSNNETETHATGNWTIFEDGNDNREQPSLSRRCSFNPLIFTCAYALAIAAIGFLCLEIYIQCKIDWRMMLKRDWKPWVTRISLVLMGFTLWPTLQVQKSSYNISWQYAVAAMGAFFTWVWFLLQIELIPKVKIYLEQLAAILMSVLRIILLFFPLFFGFYTGFNMIFSEDTGVMRFILMTIDPSGVNPIENNDTDSRFTVLANLFMVGFIVVISLVFMNYMLAASVSDIEFLKHSARDLEISIKIQRLFLIDILYSKNDTNDNEEGNGFKLKTDDPECNMELPREIRKGIYKILYQRELKIQDQFISNNSS